MQQGCGVTPESAVVGQFLPDLPDLPDLVERLLEREPDGADRLAGADGREKPLDEEGALEDRKAEDLVERVMEREGLLSLDRENAGLLEFVFFDGLVTEGIRLRDSELRDSTCREGRGKSVFRSGIDVIRSRPVGPVEGSLLPVEGGRYVRGSLAPLVTGGSGGLDFLGTVAGSRLVEGGLGVRSVCEPRRASGRGDASRLSDVVTGGATLRP